MYDLFCGLFNECDDLFIFQISDLRPVPLLDWVFCTQHEETGRMLIGYFTMLICNMYDLFCDLFPPISTTYGYSQCNSVWAIWTCSSEVVVRRNNNTESESEFESGSETDVESVVSENVLLGDDWGLEGSSENSDGAEAEVDGTDAVVPEAAEPRRQRRRIEH